MGEQHEYREDFTEEVMHKCALTTSKCSRFFAKVLQVVANKHISELDRFEHWHKLAYSNYIQNLLPKSRKAPSSEDWDRGADAFFQQLSMSKPQVLVVLGVRLWKNIPKLHGFGVKSMRLPNDVFPLPQSEPDRDVVVNEAHAYVFEVGGKKHLTIAVHVLHPSGRGFDWHVAAKRVNTVRFFYSNVAVSDEFENCAPVRLD